MDNANFVGHLTDISSHPEAGKLYHKVLLHKQNPLIDFPQNLPKTFILSEVRICGE